MCTSEHHQHLPITTTAPHSILFPIIACAPRQRTSTGFVQVNPFIRDVTNYPCGLRTETPDQKCQESLSIKNEGMETRGERAGSQGLISTPASEVRMSYDRPDTTTKLTMTFVLHQA